MGIDTTPFSANLYPFDYEAKFISNLIKTDKPRAIKFKNVCHFIDDEFNLNSFPSLFM